MEDRPDGPEPTEQPAPPAAAQPTSNQISIDRFFDIELRVARILTAEKVEKADKLLKLEVDLGHEKRQLVAGIAESYAVDSLVGKTIVVVANLKPARIRGVESQGMLLAADLGGRPIVVTFDEAVPAGTRVR